MSFSIQSESSQDGQRLIIVDINLEHNHGILRSLYDHLPSERKLTDKEKEKVSVQNAPCEC